MAGSVVIVGAGPAGALLAFLLARRQIGVTLLERQTDFEREFRGEVLMPSGIDALAQAGLGTQLRDIPTTRATTMGLYRGSQLKLIVPMGQLQQVPLIVPQPQLLEMIVTQAAGWESFKLERGVTVRDLIEEKGRVVGVRADTHMGPREWRADFIVACDGRESVVRRRLSPRSDATAQIFDVVWAKVPLDGFRFDPQVRGYLSVGHLVIAYQSPLGHLQIGWVIEKGRFGDLRRLGEEWIDELAPHVSADLAEFLRGQRHAISRPFLLSVVCDRVVDWTAPGVLMLGDASHPMSPVGGQGINVALRDAIVAANHLVPALLSDALMPGELDRAARRIQEERRPEIVSIQRRQQVAPRLFFRDSVLSRIVLSEPFIALARTILAPLLVRGSQAFLNGVTTVRLHDERPAASVRSTA